MTSFPPYPVTGQKKLDEWFHKMLEQIRRDEEALGNGIAKDWSDYQNIVGRIHGTKTALNAFKKASNTKE